MPTEPIIRTIRRYSGVDHAWLQGERAVLVAVRRGDEVLLDDESIGTLCANDRVDFALLLEEDDGVERASWVCPDAALHELGAVEGHWAGTMPNRTLFRVYTIQHALT